MLMFILRRLGFICISIIVISIVLFSIFQQMPGDPVLRMMADRIDQLTAEEFEAEYEAVKLMMGIDGPVVIQYFRWITRMATGDWGFSIVQRRPVLDAIRVPIGWTVMLNLVVVSSTLLITIPLGIYSAVKRGKAFDNVTLVFTTIGFSMPTFLVAILFLVVFSVYLQLLPIAGMISPIPPDTTWLRFVDRLRHMILPVGTLVFVSLAGMTRYVRAQMCDALSEDYVRTARSKGLKDKVVIYSHAFRNILVPIVTLLAGTLMGLFGGSVVIETIFSWSGMGQVMVSSIFNGDYSVVMAMNVFVAGISLVIILLMDLAYTIVDPRIRASRR